MKKKANVDIAGVVQKIGDTQTFASGFAKRQVVIDCATSNYPCPVAVDFFRDAVKQADSLHEGDEVEITGFVNGREYNGRFFVNLHVKSCIVTNVAANAETDSADDSTDELPF
jgi:single-strand DNA-binding protein